MALPKPLFLRVGRLGVCWLTSHEGLLFGIDLQIMYICIYIYDSTPARIEKLSTDYMGVLYTNTLHAHGRLLTCTLVGTLDPRRYGTCDNSVTLTLFKMLRIWKPEGIILIYSSKNLCFFLGVSATQITFKSSPFRIPSGQVYGWPSLTKLAELFIVASFASIALEIWSFGLSWLSLGTLVFTLRSK